MPPTAPDADAVARLQRHMADLARARAAVARVVIGQQQAVDELFVALLAGGHVLVEGAPGLGKTLMVRTVAEVCGLSFSRIQFTPDLMPADVTGSLTLVYDDRGRAATLFQKGPIFAQLVLTDEINRATPKTQSALLEAMQETTVTVAGEEHPLPRPFFVLATQNPIEMEGTYVLPEAQVDRFFFKIVIPYPDAAGLDEILTRTTGAEVDVPEVVMAPAGILALQAATRRVPLASHVRQRIVAFVLATQPDDPASSAEVRKYVRYGVSPRGAQAVVLAAKARALLLGRFNVSLDDVAAILAPALRHRIQLNYAASQDEVRLERLLDQVWAASERPRAR